jgi:hypothetical protein
MNPAAPVTSTRIAAAKHLAASGMTTGGPLSQFRKAGNQVNAL